MNDHELDLALDAIGEQRTRVTTPPVLRARARAVPLETSPPSAWRRLTDIGGLRSMFSATKLMFAGVVVALLGAFLVSGILPTSNQQTVPGAEASPTASPEATEDQSTTTIDPITLVSGRFGLDADARPDEPETSALAGGGERQVESWPHIPVDVSDERLNADLMLRVTIDEYPGVSYQRTEMRTEMRIETPEGAWQSEPISIILGESEPRGFGFGDTVWVGEGAYEGLRLVANVDAFGFGFDLEGFIVEATD